MRLQQSVLEINGCPKPAMSEKFTQIMGGQKPGDHVFLENGGFCPPDGSTGGGNVPRIAGLRFPEERFSVGEGVFGRERGGDGGMPGHDGAGWRFLAG